MDIDRFSGDSSPASSDGSPRAPTRQSFGAYAPPALSRAKDNRSENRDVLSSSCWLSSEMRSEAASPRSSNHESTMGQEQLPRKREETSDSGEEAGSKWLDSSAPALLKLESAPVSCHIDPAPRKSLITVQIVPTAKSLPRLRQRGMMPVSDSSSDEEDGGVRPPVIRPPSGLGGTPVRRSMLPENPRKSMWD